MLTAESRQSSPAAVFAVSGDLRHDALLAGGVVCYPARR